MPGVGRAGTWMVCLGAMTAAVSVGLAQPTLEVRSVPAGVEVSWPATATGYLPESANALGSGQPWNAVQEAVSVVGDRQVLVLPAGALARFVRLRQVVTSPVTVAWTSPAAGEAGVSVTRETVFQLTAPLAAEAVITGDRLFADAAGRRLLARPEISADRRLVSLFYQEPLPAGSRVEVTFDGTGLAGAAGGALDLDGDGNPGGASVLIFDTARTAPLPGTAITGRVLASEPGANGVDVPLPGVTITVDGLEETLRAVTDATGSFRLQPCPAGRFFVLVDGRTSPAGQWPSGAYYPALGKGWEAVPGKTNNLAGGTGIIYLPKIAAGTLQPVSPTVETVVTFPASVIEANPALAGVEIMVPPNNLFDDNGARGGLIGLAPVASDRLPEPLPAGLVHAIDISIQTSGPQNFDRPVPAKFPNLPDPVTGVKLPPGAKTALWSFNHDTGRWEMQGSMTITPDGNFAVTDPDVGIRQPGWHGASPGSGGGGGPGGGGGGCPDGGGGGGGLLAEGTSGGGGGNCDCKEEPSENKKKEQECFARAAECAMKCYEKCGSGGPVNNFKKAFKLGRECKKAADCSVKCKQDGEKCKDHWQKCFLGGGGFFRQASLAGPEPESDPAVLEAQRIAEDLDALDPLWNELDALMGQAATFEELSAQDQAEFDAVIAQLDSLFQGRPVDQWVAERLARLVQLVLQSPYAEEIYPAESGFYALEDLSSGLQRRGRTDPRGYLTGVIFRPESAYRISLLLGPTLIYHQAEFTSAAAGQVTRIPYGAPLAFSPTDADNDGVPADAEFVLGTNDLKPDSDDDGVKDIEELRNRTNPLDGQPSATGIIASLNTPGTAVDVAVAENLALVADGPAGIALVDVTDPASPSLIRQIDTSGSATAVAIGNVRAAVADGDGGLLILDVADPADAQVLTTVALPGTSRAVGISAGLAYVGSAHGLISQVDLFTGAVLRQLTLPVNPSISDLAFQDGYLYVWAAGKLHTVEVSEAGLVWKASIDAQAQFANIEPVRRRLHAGPGRLYTTHLQGVVVFDLPEPGLPVLRQRHDTAQTAWKQIVPALANFALAADGVNFIAAEPHDVSVYSLGDDGTGLEFITSFPTPGLSHALALGKGFAFVADGAAGLHVVNFLAPDTAGVPPTLQLTADFSLDPPRIESGQPGRLTALARDDVMIRKVEFYRGGVLAFSDATWPFEFEFTAPPLTETVTSVAFSVRAIDTAGNTTSADLTVALLPDQTAPRVLWVGPPHGSVADNVTMVMARFNEPLDPASVTGLRVRLLSAGSDSVFGTPDDTVVPGSVGYSGTAFGAQIELPAPLPNGRYRYQVSDLRDLVGNIQSDPVSSDFWIAPGGPDGDPDGDGLTNTRESQALTNPFNEDTDGDGWADEVEVHQGTNPRDAASRPAMLIRAMPPVALGLEHPGEMLSATPGPVVANPRVDVWIVSADEDAPAGPFFARPGVGLQIGSPSEAAPGGPHVARPPVQLRVQSTDEEAPPGPYLAQPPVTLERP